MALQMASLAQQSGQTPTSSHSNEVGECLGRNSAEWTEVMSLLSFTRENRGAIYSSRAQ